MGPKLGEFSFSGIMNPILTTHIFSGWVGKKPATSWWIGGGKKLEVQTLVTTIITGIFSGPMLHEGDPLPPLFLVVFTNLRELRGGFQSLGKRRGNHQQAAVGFSAGFSCLNKKKYLSCHHLPVPSMCGIFPYKIG